MTPVPATILVLVAPSPYLSEKIPPFLTTSWVQTSAVLLSTPLLSGEEDLAVSVCQAGRVGLSALDDRMQIDRSSVQVSLMDYFTRLGKDENRTKSSTIIILRLRQMSRTSRYSNYLQVLLITIPKVRGSSTDLLSLASAVLTD